MGTIKWAGIVLGVIGLGLGLAGFTLGSGEKDAIGQLERSQGESTGYKANLDGKEVWEHRSTLTIDGNVFQKSLYQTDNGASVKYVITTPTKRIEAVRQDGAWNEKVVKDELSGARTTLYLAALCALGIGLGLFFFAPTPGGATAGKAP